MFQRPHRQLLVAVMAIILSWTSSDAAADEISKEVCLESHGKGQDAKTEGKISLARKLFMTCAQASCPALVQSDCARLADDLERHQPWLSFAARDSQGNDLPDTAVYVDDELVATRLGDGSPHEIDPGRHEVRFTNGGREHEITIVVGSGEKGRTVVGTFETPQVSVPSEQPVSSSSQTLAPRSRPLGARLMIGAGTAAIVGGGVLGVVGLTQVPAKCSISTHECAAPPGHVSFDNAADAIRLSNIGWAITGAGAAMMVGGLVWYFRASGDETGEKNNKSDKKAAVLPWATADGAGVAVSGQL